MPDQLTCEPFHHWSCATGKKVFIPKVIPLPSNLPNLPWLSSVCSPSEVGPFNEAPSALWHAQTLLLRRLQSMPTSCCPASG